MLRNIIKRAFSSKPQKAHIDHIIIAASSLESGCDYVEEKLGVRPVQGGEHERWNTHNALLSLGDMTYLEVISLQPVKPFLKVDPYDERYYSMEGKIKKIPFGLDGNDLPRLTTWSCSGVDLSKIPFQSQRAGIAI